MKLHDLLHRLTAAWRRLREEPRRAAGPGARPMPVSAPIPPQDAEPPKACVSVIIPALNEAARIGEVVRYAWSDPATGEVIVVDDSSIDDTASLAREAGATVITSTMLGKGASMRDGLHASSFELLAYLDGDLSGLRPGIVTTLVQPLAAGRADFVKARFGRGGGRVTELTAKPMLRVFFPELARFEQPLGGLIAARKTLLRPLEFEDGYGVDIGLLIDAHRAGALLEEVDIGSLQHDSQPLLDLTAMANEVARVVYSRARQAGRLHAEQITAMYESQRQATASIGYILSRRRQRTRLLLLDLSALLTANSYAQELARATGAMAALQALQAAQEPHAQRSEGGPGFDADTARLFRFVHRRQFEQVAQDMALRPGAIEWVNQMRRAGFMVGVVSTSPFVAADILRRRVFADFAIAHTLQFDGEVCTGEYRLNPAFLPLQRQQEATPCKRHIVDRFRQDGVQHCFEEIWAVGRHADTVEMLRYADRAWVLGADARALARRAKARVAASFEDLRAETADMVLSTSSTSNG